MYEAPDPTEVIESLMKNVTGSSSHMIEIDRLKAEVAQYELEFQQLRNQVRVTCDAVGDVLCDA
jgi:hypothetical protein